MCHKTGMTAHNLATVWAPTLLRCKEKEEAAQLCVETQVTEILIHYANKIFPTPEGNALC
jgi:hypothetical protein